MATTPRGYPIYSVDDPTNGPAQMEAIARAIDTDIADGTDIIRAANSSGYPSSPVVGQRVDDASLGGTVRWNGSIWVPIDTDTGWLDCGQGTAGVSGLKKVCRIGRGVFGQLNLTNGGTWPNSGFTFFILPDVSFAPLSFHRMSGGGPNQATAGHINLIGTPGSTSVTGGATGSAGGVFQWSGLLWLVS